MGQNGRIQSKSSGNAILNFSTTKSGFAKIKAAFFYFTRTSLNVILFHSKAETESSIDIFSSFSMHPLKNKIFPELRMSLRGSPIRMWSAAASSGEEIYSLYLLASSMGLKTECVASDINTAVLKKCETGEYNANSLRSVDGSAFRHLIAPYLKDGSAVAFPPDISAKIERRQINLAKREAIFPKNMHVIFVRNVFVYFTIEMRTAILQKIADESLADGGYLFVSRSETATIDRAMLPKNLKKCSDGSIFYFQKVG